MQFQFDPKQEYQLEAIQAVVDLFAGQPCVSAGLTFGAESGLAAVPNHLDLSENDLLANLRAVQTRNGIAPDTALAMLEGPLDGAPNGNGAGAARFANFSIEMETGTGKTYVYLRTILELARRYGLRKYIIVAPSVAIREGVLKTLEMTREHLRGLYDNLPYRYDVYDAANIARVRGLALSNQVEIMVMTLASFNRDANVIRQGTDRLQGETPLHLVQAARPILILDEPQNMESDLSKAALATLNPLFALRYSATHRAPYNIVYRLTPWEAYRQGLVKRVEVAGAQTEDAYGQPYIRLDGVQTRKQTVTARVALYAVTKGGDLRGCSFTLRVGDRLDERTARADYAPFQVEEINPGGGFVRFTNGLELRVGEETGSDRDALFEAQIHYTVEEHLRKQRRLRDQGIKVLSVFFVDRVDNFAREDGIIRRLFAQAYSNLQAQYPEWRERRVEEVQAAYFAQRRNREGQVILEDSRTGEAERDREAYDLIMRDKERLLSFDTPQAFIFSHSALKEGWDNPNVFQICTLRQVGTETERRQQVGRGVRLAVNQRGERVFDRQVNVLTVVASESYQAFAANYQDEIAAEFRSEIEARYGKPLDDLDETERRAIEAEYGAGILPPKIEDARQKTMVRLRKEYTLKPEFQQLWARIREKTRYHVLIDSERLIDSVVADLAHVEIRPPRVTIAKAALQANDDNIFEAVGLSGARVMVDLAGRHPLPNLLEVMANLMEHSTPPMRLTRKTLLEILRRAPEHCQRAMVANPSEYATEVVRCIKARLAEELVRGIRYIRMGECYEMTQWDTEFRAWAANLEPSLRPDDSPGHSLYDHAPVQSQIERDFVLALEHRDDVRLYVKLPGWFTVDTPVGQYNPDWAIVMDNPQPGGEPLLYLVRETKGTHDRNALRPDERRKITCAEGHFGDALKVDYRLVVSADELP
jgi:type III restriction enzyme